MGNAGKGSRIGCLFLFRKVRVLDIYTDRVEGDGKWMPKKASSN